MRRTTLRAILAAFLVAIFASRSAAQPEDPPVGVAVKIWTRGAVTPGEGENGGVTISGSFLASAPGASDGSVTASNSSSTYGEIIVAPLAYGTSQSYVRVEPGKIYSLDVNCWNYSGGVDIVAPPGYRLLINGIERNRMPVDSSTTFVFELRSRGARHPGLAGLATDIASNDVDWRISLGSLRNGDSAGDLALVDTGTRSDWSPLFTPSALYYEPTSFEVTVYRPYNIIRQIISNQMALDVVTLSSSSYEIRCYHPSQILTTSMNPWSFSGSPCVTYRIEPGSTSTTIKITKEVRNVTDATTTFSIARTEYMFLKREDSWPTFKWTRTDWSTSSTPSSAPTETYTDSTGTTSSRAESIVVRVPGSSAVTTLTRNYTVPTVGGVSVIGEVLSSETLGTSTGLAATFNYYTDASQFGSLGYLRSATVPGGNWSAYEYYETDLNSGFQGGRIHFRYKPYLDSPSAVPSTLSTTSGEVTSYEYTNDVWGVPSRRSLEQNYINGTLVSKATTSYNDSYATANGLAVTQVTRSEYSDSSQNLQTITRYYREDASNSLLRGRTHSITKPDGVKQSFACEVGSWDGSTFTSAGITNGTASRMVTITGSSSSGAALSSIDGYYTLDTIYLTNGKSTKEVTIRDNRALVVRTESHVWYGGWVLVGWTNYGYDFGGRLTSRTAHNGATYSASYDGGLKASETDEAGVTTSYTYDAAGRVAAATRASGTSGSVTISALATRYTYDAAGRCTKEEVGYDLASPITTQRSFDTAGRPTSLTPPGNYGYESYDYDVVNRTKTTTRADSSTLVTANYLDGRRKSLTGTATVAEYDTYGVETTTALSGQQWHKVNIGSSSSARWNQSWVDWLGRGIKTEAPGAIGPSNVRLENVVTQNFYEAGTGHLIKTTKTGYAPTLYQYNVQGQVIRSGLDCDNNGTLDLASGDRITDTDTYLESYSENSVVAWWMRTDTKTYPYLGSGQAITTAVSRTRLTNFDTNRLSETISIDIEGNVTKQTVDVNRSAKTSTATTSRTGISPVMTEHTLNGFSIDATGFDGLTTYKGYDSYLRPSTVKDSRNNTTTTTYVTGTRMVSTVTNQAGNQSVTSYDNMGRVAYQRDPLNYKTRFAYNARGQLYRQWGAGAMPVEYGYDSTYGDKIAMKTYRGGSGWDTDTGDGGNTANPWPSSPGTADWTRWTYDEPTGLLVSKYDAVNLDSSGNPITNAKKVSQAYNLRGQTATRTLARNVTTTYGYDGATGELISQTYSDSTPALGYSYGRTGQVETVTDTTGTRDLVYDVVYHPWRLTAEAESAFYGGRVATRLYDDTTAGFIGRVKGFEVGAAVGSDSDLAQTFGFTTIGRLLTVTTVRQADSSTARTFRYAYRSDSALLESLAIDQNGGPGGHPFTITRSYEGTRDVITDVATQWSAAVRTSYHYEVDARGLRSKVVQSGDAFSDYGDVTSQQFVYNGRGELTGAVGYMGSDITISSKQLPGRRYGYGYDSAGNRKWSDRTGVDANSDGLPDLRDNYTTNALNQYTDRENNALPVSGTAEVDNGGANGVAVAIQGGTLGPIAASRQGRYWNSEIVVNNNYGTTPTTPSSTTKNPWRGPLTIFTAKRGSSGSADLYRADARLAEIAPALQKFTYDDDGNLTSDGIADYTWDGENRLIRMETTTLAQNWGFPHRELTFRYDYMGRRIQKRVMEEMSTNNWSEISSRRYLYDGWNVIAEYFAPGGSTCGALVRSYTWGLDIALSQTDAGGVGALLQIADHPTGKTYLPSYDGNGNVVALFNAATSGGSAGALTACYEYSPFGESLRAQVLDSTVADNPFRFSTKWTDSETGLVYYGHRYYAPNNGRFINKDPIEEAGGLNLYGFCGNNAVNRWDLLGNWSVDETSYGTYWATGKDMGGLVGTWQFSTREDAECWAQAWEEHELGIVEPYLDQIGDAASRAEYLRGKYAIVVDGDTYRFNTPTTQWGTTDQDSFHLWLSDFLRSRPVDPTQAEGGAQSPSPFDRSYALMIDGLTIGNLTQSEFNEFAVLAYILEQMPTAAAPTPQAFPSTNYPFYQVYGQGTCAVETARNIAYMLTGKSVSDSRAISIAAQLTGQTPQQITTSGLDMSVVANIVNVIGGAAFVAQTNSLSNFTNLVKDGQPIGIVVPNPSGGVGSHAVTIQYNQSTGTLSYINSWAKYDYRTGSYSATVTTATIADVYASLKSTTIIVGIPVTTGNPPKG